MLRQKNDIHNLSQNKQKVKKKYEKIPLTRYCSYHKIFVVSVQTVRVRRWQMQELIISIKVRRYRDLANIKSAKKRILVSRTREERNKAIRSGVKTAVKKVYAAIEAGDKKAAQEALLKATSTIDKATGKGVYHKNYASRKISRLNLAVNKLA